MAKLRITVKDPDGVWDSLEEAGVNPNELDESEFGDVVRKYTEYLEYITIELDTDTMSATVVPK